MRKHRFIALLSRYNKAFQKLNDSHPHSLHYPRTKKEFENAKAALVDCATREDNSEVKINVITHKGVKVERQKL